MQMSAQHSIRLGKQWASAGVTTERGQIFLAGFLGDLGVRGGENNLLDIYLDHLGVHAAGRSLRGHGDSGGALGQNDKMFKAATVKNQGHPLAVDHYGSIALGRALKL